MFLLFPVSLELLFYLFVVFVFLLLLLLLLFFRVFIMKGCWLCGRLFLHLLKWWWCVFCPWFCLCVVLCLLIYMYVVPSLFPWNETYLIMVYIVLMCCWIWFTSILLKIFASVFIRDIDLSFLFSGVGVEMYLYLVWY
jgi:hypothetical protein